MMPSVVHRKYGNLPLHTQRAALNMCLLACFLAMAVLCVLLQPLRGDSTINVSD